MAAIKCDRMDFFIAPSNLSYRLLGITKWKILWEIWGFRSESNVMNFTAHSFTHLIVLVCFFFCFILRKKMFALHFAVNLFLKYEALVIRYTHIYIVPKMVHSFLKSLLHRIFLFGSLFCFGKTSMFFFVIALFSVHIFLFLFFARSLPVNISWEKNIDVKCGIRVRFVRCCCCWSKFVAFDR